MGTADARALICTWLRLPEGNWPPNHYVLLGLSPEEADAGRIQEAVHQRLEWLRCYQLTHPDEVTAAMNQLALAFTCLTDPEARAAYDAQLFPNRTSSPAPAPTGETIPSEIPPPHPADPLAWLFGPWNQASSVPVVALAPRREETPSSAPTTPVTAAEGTPNRSPATAEVAPPAPAPEASPAAQTVSPPPREEPPDPLTELAQSAVARRGLGTRRALYQRLRRTRELLAAWEQVGQYVGDPKRKVQRRGEALHMVELLNQVRDLLYGFPAILGQAGQPGYSVIALARQPMILQTFQTLLPSQREVLAQHWKTGWLLLDAHRRFLRREVRLVRRQGRCARLGRALHALFLDHPGPWLIVLALLALNIAYPPLRTAPLVSGVLFGVLLLLDALLRGRWPRKSWLERRLPEE